MPQTHDREIRLNRVIWPAVRTSGELLTSGDLSRVHRCAADECDWLFLDTSRSVAPVRDPEAGMERERNMARLAITVEGYGGSMGLLV